MHTTHDGTHGTSDLTESAIIHVVRAIVAAPERYPDAFDLAALGLAYRAQCFAEPVLTATTAGSTTASAGHKSRTSDDAKKRK